VRWWGGSRKPAAVVVALREQSLLGAIRDGALAPVQHLEEVTPKLAEFVNRRIFGALEYVIPSSPARAKACAWRSFSTRTATRRRNRCSNNCWGTTPRSTRRSATMRATWPTRG